MKSLFAVVVFILGNIAFATPDENLFKSLGYTTNKKEVLCMPENFHSDFEIEQEIKLLKYFGEIDEMRCVDLTYDPTGHKRKLYNLIVESSSTMEVSAQSFHPSELAVIYTPTSDHQGFVFERDDAYLKTTTVVLGSIVLGNLVSDHVYEGQTDKTSHARVGGIISGTATAGSLLAAYFVPDSRLSPKLKTLLVGCSGFVVSTLAGAVKEAMDSRDSTNHTVDKHDFFATSLGGGAGLGCAFSFAF